MLEIIDFVKESLFMILFVTFKINLLCEKKVKKKKSSAQISDKSRNLKRKDDEDKLEIDDNLSIDAKIWEKTHGSWHDSN